MQTRHASSGRGSRAARPIALAGTLVFAIAACGGSAVPPGGTDDGGLQTPAATAAAPSTIEPHSAAPNPTDGGGGSGEEPDMGSGRSVQVSATVSGTTNGMDGAYQASGLARACGNAVLNLTGNTKAFNLYFPQDDAGDIDDVTFDADDLLAGASTTSFYLNLNVTNAAGHAPPALVVDTRDAGSGDTGTAERTSSGGSTTLTVHATNDAGQTVVLTATCGPRP